MQIFEVSLYSWQWGAISFILCTLPPFQILSKLSPPPPTSLSPPLWCVFYPTRQHVYWGLTHNVVFTGTLIWYNTYTNTQHTQGPVDWHLHISIYLHHLLCAHSSYIYYIKWLNEWIPLWVLQKTSSKNVACTIYIYLYFLIHTLLFCWKTKNCCDSWFPQHIRPQTTVELYIYYKTIVVWVLVAILANAAYYL